MSASPKQLFLRAARKNRRPFDSRRYRLQEQLDELDHMQSWIGGALPDHLRNKRRYLQHELEELDQREREGRTTPVIDLRLL